MPTAGSRSVNTALTITHLPAFFSLLFQWTWVYSFFRKCRLGKGWLMVIQDRPAWGRGWAVWEHSTPQSGRQKPKLGADAGGHWATTGGARGSLPACVPLTGSACRGGCGPSRTWPDVVLSWPSGQYWFRTAGLTGREVIATLGTETQTWGQSHTRGQHHPGLWGGHHGQAAGPQGPWMSSQPCGCSTESWGLEGQEGGRGSVGTFCRRAVHCTPNGQQVRDSSKNNPGHMEIMGAEETGSCWHSSNTAGWNKSCISVLLLAMVLTWTVLPFPRLFAKRSSRRSLAIGRKMLSTDDSVHLVAVGFTGLNQFGQRIQNCSSAMFKFTQNIHLNLPSWFFSNTHSTWLWLLSVASIIHFRLFSFCLD